MARQPQQEQPQESGTFEVACAGDRCAATLGDLTLSAGRIRPDGSWGFAGTAFGGTVELAQGGSATYGGRAAFRNASAGAGNGGDEHGEVTLTADFAAKTISGRVEGVNGSPVRLILNPASPRSDGDFRTFEASSVECQAGVSCDAGEWSGQFGRGNTVGAAFSASLNGEEALTGALIGAAAESSPEPGQAGGADAESPQEPGQAVEWPDWPIPDVAAARRNTGGLEIEALSSDAIRGNLLRLAPPGHIGRSATTISSGNVHWWLDNNVEFSPVMTATGSIPLFQAHTSTESHGRGDTAPEGLVGLGGWMEYGWFIMGLGTPLCAARESHLCGGDGLLQPTTISGWVRTDYDYPNRVNFPENMHWHGTMIGTDKTMSATPNLVESQVDITVRDDDQYNTKVEVDFRLIRDVNTGRAYPNMEWNINLNQGGGFFISASLSNGRGNSPGLNVSLEGHITGPNGEEIVGEFDDVTLKGVFGAKRHICIPSPCVH